MAKNKNRNADNKGTNPTGNAAGAAAVAQAANPQVEGNTAVEGAGDPETENKRRGRSSENIIIDPDTNQAIVLLTEGANAEQDVAQGVKYAGLFLAKKMEYSGGYKKFITHNGYSNSDFPKEMETPGHLMVCVITLAVLGDRAAKGDEEAKRSLKMVQNFAKHAESNAVAVAQMEHIKALEALGIDVSQLTVQTSGAKKTAAAK